MKIFGNKGPQKPTEMESRKRNLQGTVWGQILVVVAVTMSLFHFYAAGAGGITPLLMRAVHLAFASTLIFILYRAGGHSPEKRISVLDGIGILLSCAMAVYLIMTFDQLAMRAGNPSKLDVILGISAILIVLEITRRTTGWLLTIIGACIILYAYFGPAMPGPLAHRGFDIEKIASYMYTTTDGLYGLTLGVSSTYIFFFILFGAFLDSMGAGKFFIEFAYSIAGRIKGGPAQTVVLANGLMSTISGVPAADVVTIGAFTFPLLNKLGYNRIFSAGLSAVASTGAMITPPVMGSAAFLMAEMTGIPYREICFAAAIPAFLYYLSLFATVHFYSSKNNMVAQSADQLPKVVRVLREGWYNMVPVFVLLYLLIVKDISPMLSGYYSVWSLLVIVLLTVVIKGSLKQDFKKYVQNIVTALKKAALGALPVVSTCAVAGLLVGVLNLTGLGLKFSAIMLELSGGNLLLSLIFSAAASIILGMGLPIAACYVILAVLVAPALIKMGLSPMATHLFILFFGSFSAITPPVAIAAYAAAAMNKVDPVRVGLYACWLAMAAFIIPFMFVYGPSLLMIGSATDVSVTFVSASVGIIALSACIMGWLIGRAGILQRVLLFSGAMLMIKPGIFTDLVGLGLILLVIAWQLVQGKQTGWVRA
jgi:TRAP transporter 4TM/12TM fusion protein